LVCDAKKQRDRSMRERMEAYHAVFNKYSFLLLPIRLSIRLHGE